MPPRIRKADQAPVEALVERDVPRRPAVADVTVPVVAIGKGTQQLAHDAAAACRHFDRSAGVDTDS